MISVSTLVAFLTIVPSAQAVPQSLVGRSYKAPKVIPSVWSQGGAAKASAPLIFTFALNSERDSNELDAKIASIAMDPNAQWLTKEELATYVAPSASAKATVEAAIKSMRGASFSYSSLGDKVTVQTTVDEAAKVCKTFLLQLNLDTDQYNLF